MAERTFDRETLLDLTVNIIPLGIILFFVVVFLAVQPWGPNLYMETVSMGLLVIPFVALAALTYFSGRIISRDEGTTGEADSEVDLSSTDATLSEQEPEEEAGEDYEMVEDTLDAEPDEDDTN
ncbi:MULTISPECIES: DUF6684 family protein [Halococcus]|uniref:DUF6684 family protein n=1 Tax=Halococcus TaxID=2249 RepID=UPI000E74DE36|nr:MULTISPECIES: DUF6684 family protein [Halococcus]RJT02540.1 cox cluster protein [Halococcus sp. IIIV-5B]